MRQDRTKKRIIVDVILVILAMITSICVRLGSISDNVERFRKDCFYLTDKAVNDCREKYYDENHRPYLFELDSYYYLNILHDLRDGVEVSDKYSFMPVFISIIWSLMNFFYNASVEQLAVYIGPIIFAFLCIPVYIFVKRRSNRVGGFCASVLVGTCAAFVNYISFARFDTDILIYPLATCSVLGFIAAMESNLIKKRITSFSLGVLSFLLLSLSWGSFSVYFFIICLISFVIIFIIAFKEKFRFKKLLARSDFFVAVLYPICLFCITLLFGNYISFGKIESIITWLSAGTYSNLNKTIYPDGRMDVAEIQKAPLLSGGVFGLFDASEIGIINWLGGIFLCAFVLCVLIFFVNRIIKYISPRNGTINNEKINITYIALFVWCACGIVCAFSGIRFLKESSLPLMITTGLGYGVFFDKYRTRGAWNILVVLLGCLIVFPSLRSYASFKHSVPSINDTIDDAALYIVDNFDDSYVIISWWNFGYYYLYRTNNLVFSDGGSGNKEVYWSTEAFMVDNEKFSSGLFKVLANIRDRFSVLEYLVGGEKNGVEVIRFSATHNRNVVEKMVESQFDLSKDKALLVADLMFGSKKPLVVVDSGMVGLSGLLSYFHCWNFDTLESLCEDIEEVDYDNGGAKLDKKNSNEKSILDKLYSNDAVDGFVLQKRIKSDAIDDGFENNNITGGNNSDSVVLWTVE